MKNNTFFSICIPTYNRAKIVRDTVEQCLDISTEECEVVVTDNCSTDDTFKELSEIKNNRFFYYRNDKNIGYENLMQSVKNAHGRFRMVLCDDDIIDVKSLEPLLDYLKRNSEYAVFQFPYLDENKKTLIKGKEKHLSAGSYKLLSYVLDKNFYYFGGMIINGVILEQVWDEINNKGNMYWKLYNHTVVPLYCSIYGDYGFTELVSTSKTKRNASTNIDNEAITGGNGQNPYWGLISRWEQAEGLSKILESLPITEKLSIDLRQKTYLNYYKTIFWYWISIFNDYCFDNPIFLKYKKIIEEDRNKTLQDWQVFLCFSRKKIGEELSKIEKQVGRKRKVSVRLKDFVYYTFTRMSIWFIKKWHKERV